MESKKAQERYYAECFLRGFVDYVSLEDGERPDFWVRRNGTLDFGLEVTCYHPSADEIQNVRRAEIESRWRDSFEPALNRIRKTKPALRQTEVSLSFADARLPKNRDHELLIRELVELLDYLVPQILSGKEIGIEFVSEKALRQFSNEDQDYVFLPQEAWPHCCRHFSSLSVTDGVGVDWPYWHCPQVELAWLGGCPKEFRRVFEGKSSKASSYQMDSRPLWLLVVCDLNNDTKSHIFPTASFEAIEIIQVVRSSGFDFTAAPFDQVWLFSAFTLHRMQIYPFDTRDPAITIATLGQSES